MHAQTFKAEVIQLLTHLKDKHLKLTEELRNIERQMEAVSITAGLLGESRPLVVEAPSPKLAAVKIQDLVGKSARRALVLIAEANGGVLRIADAKELIVGAGILKPKNIWGAIYTTLTRSKEFEKHPEDKGTFLLRDFSGAANSPQADLPLQQSSA